MARVYPSPVTIAHKCSTAGSAQSDEKRELFWLDARRYGMPPADLSIRVSRDIFWQSGISRVKRGTRFCRTGELRDDLEGAPVARDERPSFHPADTAVSPDSIDGYENRSPVYSIQIISLTCS